MFEKVSCIDCVHLPCKVGDKAYFVSAGGVHDFTVGTFAVEDDNNELVVTAKVGASTYKKNYVYLNEYTLYVVEDISGTHTDPYHYKVYFDIKMPDVEIK